MSEQIAVYNRVIARFTELVDSITSSQWSLDTPCEGWTVRDLMEHILIRDQRIAATLGGPPAAPEPLDADVDLAALWHEQVAWWAAGLADPTRRETVWPTFFGEITFQQATTAMMTGEITIHTWDLARALGSDETLDPEAVEVTYADLVRLGDQVRGPGAMAPAIAAPGDANPQTRLLALTGRHVL